MSVATSAADPPMRDWEPVELVGTASDYWFDRNWRDYYWREDFSFLHTQDDNGTTWRIISREPTPAYSYRMGPTYTDLDVDWKAKPRIKVVSVKAVDRIPREFYHFKLDEAKLATALVVFVERDKTWKEVYVNNWFHKWGDKADRFVHAFYADKPEPFRVYGFVNDQAAPFDQRSQAVIDRHKANPSLMFHGRIRTAKETRFGHEIELVDLIGRNASTGGHVVLHGDRKSIPLLETRPPKE